MGLRNIVKSRTALGFRDALRNARLEVGIQRQHSRSVLKFRNSAFQRPYKVQFGCGPNLRAGWVNVDLFSEQADLQLDLRELLPFPDGSAEFIYSEHFLEHLAYPRDVKRILGESLRVLQPAGRFIVGVPDTAWPVRSYANEMEEYFRFSYAQGFLPKWCNTRMAVLNEHFRGFGVAGVGVEGFGAHKYAYDLETLSKVLREVGFVRIRERSFDPSLDSETRKIGTLYVEASKD